MMPFSTFPAGTLPGQRIIAGFVIIAGHLSLPVLMKHT
jgi:hypothetical protein